MAPEKASRDERIQEIAAAAAELRGWLKLTEEKDSHYHDDHTYETARCGRRHELMIKIVSAILFVAPAALAGLAGFKAGAAFGAIVGGGVASVPSAMIGGCVGALVGGGLGIFAGTRALSKLYGQNSFSERCVEDIHSALIHRAVQDVLPHRAP